MPTVQSMDLPKPSNWQEFESIVRDAQSQRWRSTDLQKNGRQGQSQNGVDIYGVDEIGRPVGIQCKRYKGALTLKVVTDEIDNAERFSGKLTTLYIATTAEHDATLQQQVRTLSDKRVAQGKFAVTTLFWDEIVSGLILNPAVFRAHYPQVNLFAPSEVCRERQLAALELGYYGADIRAYILLTYGQFGWLAQADPDEFISKLRIVESRVQGLLPPKDAEPILGSLSEVRKGCLAKKTSKSDWDPVEDYAKRASSRIKTASSLLVSLPESNALELGVHLGLIYHRADDLPKPKVRNEIKEKVRAILSDASSSAIKSSFVSAKRETSGYEWSRMIYKLVEHELRYRM